jgi:hypothetical protein
MSDVKRYRLGRDEMYNECMHLIGSNDEIEGPIDPYVLASDYDALAAEVKALREALGSFVESSWQYWNDECDGAIWKHAVRQAEKALAGAADQPAAPHPDSARLDWLMDHVSGAEFRRLGIIYTNGMTREHIDRAASQTVAAPATSMDSEGAVHFHSTTEGRAK